ncbi:hypothetical protein [Candidatus Symbiopectobacterium sp. NZEC127]|nr:hypothetical protein [Candidatus Symbiopectobacterium sp. NZEC127]
MLFPCFKLYALNNDYTAVVNGFGGNKFHDDSKEKAAIKPL